MVYSIPHILFHCSFCNHIFFSYFCNLLFLNLLNKSFEKKRVRCHKRDIQIKIILITMIFLRSDIVRGVADSSLVQVLHYILTLSHLS